METIDKMVETVVDHLGTAASSGAVSGKPIVVGDVTQVVLSMVSHGQGAGGREGEGGTVPAKKGKAPAGGGGGAEGAGGAAKVRPAAVIAFTAQGVQVLPIPDEPGTFDKVVDKIPDVMEVVDKVRRTFDGRVGEA